MNKLTVEQLRALAVKKVESLKFAITQSAFTNIRRGLEEELQLDEFALAAMDSEPVAYMWNSERKDIDAPGFYQPEHLFFAESNVRQWGGKVIPLYRHAQPAPGVPEEMTPQQASRSYGGEVRGYRDGWNACRAAMLQAEPVCTCPSGDGSLRWPCSVHPGNSPVIPDGYVMVPKGSTEGMVIAGFESEPDEQ